MKLLILYVIAYALSSGQTTQYVASLSWTDSKNASGTTYSIYRASGKCSSVQTMQKIATSTVTSYADTTVTPGDWCFQVTSVAGGVEAPPSNKADGQVPPFPVEKLTVTIQLKVTTP